MSSGKVKIQIYNLIGGNKLINVDLLSNEQKDQVIYLCQELVKIKSYSGEEKEVADKIKNYAEKSEFDEVIIDEMGNVLLTMNGDREGPTLLFDGHIDTVPVNVDKWDKDPFSGEIADGKIYGRGSSDMKGAVSAMISACINFAAETNRKFPGKIVVSCSVHEERFEGVATRKISEQVKPDYVVIGEATNLNLNRGQRGRAEIIVETYGKPAHSANPQEGINAVIHMTDLLKAINELPITTNEVLGDGILELTDIISSPYPGASVVPSKCTVTYDRRLLVDETEENVLVPINELIEKLKEKNKDFDAKVYYSKGEDLCYTGAKIESERFFPAWLFEEWEGFVNNTLKALKEINPNTELGHYSFCTNGSHFAGEKSIPTIGFGPSYEHLAHIDNEYIEIEQLLGATVGYLKIMETLTKEK